MSPFSRGFWLYLTMAHVFVLCSSRREHCFDDGGASVEQAKAVAFAGSIVFIVCVCRDILTSFWLECSTKLGDCRTLSMLTSCQLQLLRLQYCIGCS